MRTPWDRRAVLAAILSLGLVPQAARTQMVSGSNAPASAGSLGASGAALPLMQPLSLPLTGAPLGGVGALPGAAFPAVVPTALSLPLSALPALTAPTQSGGALPEGFDRGLFDEGWRRTLEGLSTGRMREASLRMGEAARDALEEGRKDEPLPAAATPADPNGDYAKRLRQEWESKPKPKRNVIFPITRKDEKGIEHPLSFNPSLSKLPLWRRAVAAVQSLPDTVKRIVRFTRQVDKLIEEITDEDLSWSLSRINLLKSQEGILRSDNVSLVNTWKYRGDWLKRMSPDDLAPSSLDEGAITFLFKQAMDREQPTLQYQYSSAHNLHNHLPRVSHFMGTTLQERILQVALKGRAGQMAIWSTEEVRHGPIMQRVYESVRGANRPPLVQQGIASKQPETGEYSARSMMSNRALAEIGAGTAYLALKANMTYGSPAERVLDGIYRDEVYHYVIMAAVNKWAYGQRSRWSRLAAIIKHSFDYPTPDAADAVIHERKRPSLLTALELGYSFMAIDKRVDRYLKKVDEQTAKDWIGPVYVTDQDVQDAIARGEHTWTPTFASEQNPELLLEDVQEMERRFPGYYSAERRVLKASDIRGVLENYRKTQLRNPRYWLRKKGFYEAGPGTLKRELPGTPAGRIRLDFDKDGTVQVSIWEVSAPNGPDLKFTAGLENMSLLQIGALMDAEDLGVVEKIQAAKAGLSEKDIAAKLNRRPDSSSYAKNPIRLIED